MAVAVMHLGVWSWSRQSPELQTECQNGKERWFKRFPVVTGNMLPGLMNLDSCWDIQMVGQNLA